MAIDVQDAVDFLRVANDAASENITRGEAALRFRYGEQWPQYAVASRGLDRPRITINETNTYLKKVCNQQRQQRPRGKASPVDNLADPKIAKVITGLGRHVEVMSDADNAYDTAFDFAATIGWGYWRLRTDYIAEDSFNQDVFIDVINNPFTVRFDPASILPDGSDAERAIISTMMSREAFKREYPDAEMANFQSLGTGVSDWLTDHEVRVAEYFKIERERAKLIMLSDGKVMWQDEVERLFNAGLLAQYGLVVKGDRDSYKRVVQWAKVSGSDVLEQKKLPGRWIPVVPVYWTRVEIDGKDCIFGLVKDAMDPATLNNFWQSAITETLGQAVKPKWVMAEGQAEGHELEWKNANMSASAYLTYKQTDVDGQMAPPPSRIQPEPPPTGFIEAAFMANQNLSRVMGIFDPAVRGGAQHKSDKTLNAEQGQSELSNFDGYDNLVRSIKHSWRIMLSYFPVVYDTERVSRIIGEDGKEKIVTLNQRKQEPNPNGTGAAIDKVLNDVTVGTYDVVMETGPGYQTQRKEGVAAMMTLLDTPLGEKVAQVGDDLVVREMDFPGADVLADRMAAANPLSQIDEESNVPPQAQMQIKALQDQLQKAMQQIQGMAQELKYKGDLEKLKQDSATKRTLITATGKAHESELWSQEEARQVDSVERTRRYEADLASQTDLTVEEMKSHVALLLARIDERQKGKASADADRSAVQ